MDLAGFGLNLSLRHFTNSSEKLGKAMPYKLENSPQFVSNLDTVHFYELGLNRFNIISI